MRDARHPPRTFTEEFKRQIVDPYLQQRQAGERDRGSELDNAQVDELLEAFGIERSLSGRRACLCRNCPNKR